MARENGTERAGGANPVGAAAGQGTDWGEGRGLCGGVIVFNPCGFGWNSGLDGDFASRAPYSGGFGILSP
jgi:hypothetical protein